MIYPFIVVAVAVILGLKFIPWNRAGRLSLWLGGGALVALGCEIAAAVAMPSEMGDVSSCPTYHHGSGLFVLPLAGLAVAASCGVIASGSALVRNRAGVGRGLLICFAGLFLLLVAAIAAVVPDLCGQN